MKAATITKKLMLIITLITTVVTTAVLLLIGSGYSWFTDTRTTKVKINSSVLGSYFQSGTGTEEDPYEIHTPIQLYYFAWLQDLGAFNTTYTENGVTHIKQYHFYLSDDLDMGSPVAYVLPPAGTAKYPFVGNFNGQDKEGNYHKISNLKVSNIEALTDVPYTTDPNAQLNSYQIVGFFGIIGSTEGVTDNTYDEETGDLTSLGSVTIGGQTYTYNSIQNEVKNFLLDTCTIESKIPTDNKTLVGIAAGYVAGHMSSVGVYNSSLDIAQELAILDGENMSEKLSGYALVGYSKRAMDEYAAANISGDGEGWGGSINMKTMHNKLNHVMTQESTRLPSYVSAETVVINEVTGETTTTTTATKTMTSISGNDNTGTAYPAYYYSELGGSMFFADEATGSNTRNEYTEFYGKSATYWPKTVTTYTYKNQFDNGYVITDGTHYLVATNNGTSTTANEDDATVFIYNNNRLSFYVDINGQAGPATYYLNVNTTSGALTTGTTGTGNWTLSNGALTATISGEQRELGYFNNAWSFKKLNYALIKDGTNYLKATTTGLSAVGQSDATKWYFNSENGSGTVWTYINGTQYYLYFNGTSLSPSTNNQTTWTWDNANSALTATYNTRVYSLYYNGSNWVMYNEPCYIITDGTNYININASNGTIENTTNSANATKWTFSNGANGGVISATINNTTYYLYNNNGTLQLSTTNQTSWEVSDGNLIDGDYYINYNTNWRVSIVQAFLIKNGDSNYLRLTGTNTTSFGNTTSRANASKWQLDANGKLHSTYNNTTYYLYYYNSTTTPLRTTSQQNTATGTWSYDEETGLLTHTLNGTTRYLQLNGTTWTLTAPDTLHPLLGYRLYDSTAGQYMTSSGTTLGHTTNVNNATYWQRNGNYFYIVYNNQNYYIGQSARTSYTPILTTSTSYRHSLTNGQLYSRRYIIYQTANNRWYYQNGSGDTFEAIEVYDENTIDSIFVMELEKAIDSGTLDIEISTFIKSISRESYTDTASPITSAKERQVYTKTITTEAGGYDTYFPLASEDSGTYDVTTKNTGYIVGGTHASYQKQWGDVRISSYYNISGGRLSASLSGASAYDGALLEVLTRTYKSNGLKRVIDKYNVDNTTYSNSVSNYGRMSIAELGLEKYAASREQFEGLFADDKDTLYGMHFMDAVIDINNTITASTVMFNGDTYYNYEMAEDSIDFMLRTKGYINFFAGSYYSNGNVSNNSFFALYKIERDPSTNKILQINHITKIYGNPDDDIEEYIYQYEGQNTPTLPSGYVLMFDCNWIEQPTMVQNALYYYEVPVNRGEYALGSVNGRYGAYLIYLDISANGGDVENQAFDYLTGVDFVSSNDSDDLESMLTSIGNNNPTAIFNVSQTMVALEAQKVTFSRSADTTETSGKKKSHFTITGSTTNQSVNVKYYYVPADDKEKPEFTYLPSS